MVYGTMGAHSLQCTIYTATAKVCLMYFYLNRDVGTPIAALISSNADEMNALCFYLDINQCPLD